MAHALRNAKVPPNSATLAEAKSHVIDLFKKACRSLPTVMNLYHLDDIITVSQLRSAVSSKFRKNAHITNPKVIDLLVFNGMEELANIIEHYKQRHHIIEHGIQQIWHIFVAAAHYMWFFVYMVLPVQGSESTCTSYYAPYLTDNSGLNIFFHSCAHPHEK
ncbi:hypothetical protein H6P81_001450 [Aristolochia fimbriata]|uniref:NADH dehydrogenase [ubiquinone] 1 alpha subcomplex subunit 6 n=1 Tax=Aristolochia fimbriata TaxID=158543 RepID=A0AAV7FA69_ARIFI|nr:hypothetical protein H6P81_001450 [Aristolochia fimbriata]